MAKNNNNKNHFPPFDSKSPNTITSVTLFSKPFDIWKAFESLPVLSNVTLSKENHLPRTKKPKFPLIEETGIISLRIKDRVRRTDQNLDDETELPLGWVRYFSNRDSWICRGMKGNVPFSTSLAIDYSGGNKNFSIKVFTGVDDKKNPVGKFQICGSRSYDETTSLILIIFNELKEIEATEDDNEIVWIDPATINYGFSFGREINREKLADIFADYHFNFGYDNLVLKRIELNFETKTSKEHLKSTKNADQKIRISKNGKITMNGPDINELEETYNLLVRIFNKHYDEIIYQDKTNPDTRRKVLGLFSQSAEGTVTPKDLKKIDSSKTEIDKILDELIKENKIIKTTTGSRSVKYSVPVEKKEPVKTEINEEAVLSLLKESYGKTANEIAVELFGFENWEYVTSINSILYRKIRTGEVKKERIGSNLLFTLV